MWRWELSSIELIPQKSATKAKKARTMRKKLQGHHKSIINLITAIDKAVTWLQNSASKSSTAAAGTKLIAKVSDMEEKVLKFEREEEKARLLKEAKLQKLASKEKSTDDEKERKKSEKKVEAEAAKRKKNEEKEQEKLKKEQEKMKKKEELEEKENKRKVRTICHIVVIIGVSYLEHLFLTKVISSSGTHDVILFQGKCEKEAKGCRH